MFEYNVSTVADRQLFLKQCEALEKKLDGIKKLSILEDIDGSLIQEYEYVGKVISVINDEYIGALYIKSEIELMKFFEQRKPN